MALVLLGFGIGLLVGVFACHYLDRREARRDKQSDPLRRESPFSPR